MIKVVENWDRWSGEIEGTPRQVGSIVRDALLAIFHEHTTGYGTEVTGRLIECALKQRSLAFRVLPVAPATFRGRLVHEAPLDCLVIGECILLVFTALFDTNDFNVGRGLSYLRALRLEWGMAVNLGKKNLEIAGLRVKP